MWESLATTRAQDRVLHGLAKAAATALGLALMPLWIAGQRVSGALAAVLSRAGGGRGALPRPRGGRGKLAEVVDELQALPHRLRPSRTATMRKGLVDLWLFILTQKRETANLGYSYPSQFSYRSLESDDGERIAATVATHDEPRPGLVVVHGLVSTRRFDYVRQIAVRAYYEWGFNVAAIDLRSFGLTELLSDAPNTGGWKEGEDVLAAARHLKALGSTSVGAFGISLGASSVLGACHLPEAAEMLDGGVLASGGPGDARMAAERIDRRVPFTHPSYGLSKMFEAMLTSKVRNLGWPSEIAGFAALVERVVAPHYGLSADEIWERSSAVNHIHEAITPVLVLHAEDDDVVPVKHARMLAEAARGNPNVRVWVLPGGGHAAFDVVDRDWTWAVYRTFFERLADYGPAAAAAAPTMAEARPA